MKYPEVKKPHIVPRCHLSNFAVDDQISIHLLPDGEERTVAIDDAAVRRFFYRRTRPDGTKIDDIEWSLSRVESDVAPFMKELDQKWPLAPEVKVNVARLFALQAVRGPRWKIWHEDFVRKSVAEKRAERAHQLQNKIWVPVSDHALDELETRLNSDTQRLMKMMETGVRLISVLGAMTWDLVKFDEPLLVISDHPLVEWPIGAGQRRAEIFTGHGVSNLQEVRIPIAPDLGLLMTWKDGPDSTDVLSGTVQHAENFNAFGIAQAERQWMWKRDTRPALGGQVFGPLSDELCPGYNLLRAEHSQLRQEVKKQLNARMGSGFTNRAEVLVIS